MGRLQLTSLLISCVIATPALSAGVVLAPFPPEPPTSSSTPADPIPPETIECLVNAISAGLDPAEECDL
jgi:hypothetical protein